ncbi:MAG: EamA family transporter, partial [Ostreibacterium sp.]
MGKMAVGEIAPMTLVLLRWLVAVLVLSPFALPTVRKEWAAIRPHLLRLFSYGAFGFAAFNLLNYS